MQTAKQIQEQNSQNIFSNHLEHRRFFGTFIEERKPFQNNEIEVAALYEKLFPQAAEGTLKPDSELMNQILQPIAETIEEAKAASSDEFSKTNFKLPDDRLLKLKKMAAEADKALAGAVTPWTPTKVEEESDDHLEVLQTINRKYASVAISLEKCANFHRYHYESKPFENIVLTSKAIAEQYEKLIGLHVVFKDLMRIVNEHLGESGSLKNNNPNFREKFRERLLQLDQSMAVNNQDLSHLDLILNNHLSQNHALEIIRNAPEKWQQEISLA